MRVVQRCCSSGCVTRTLPNVKQNLITSVFSGQKLKIGRKKQKSVRSMPISCVGDVTEDNFEEEVLKAPVPVLIDFWATWCGPCKLIDPTVIWLETEHGEFLKVVKVEADKNTQLVETYKVYGLPTILLFQNGKLVEGSKREGAFTRDEVLSYLDGHGIELMETKKE